MKEVWCWWSDELSLLAAAFQELLTCPLDLTEQESCSSFQQLLIKPPVGWTSHAEINSTCKTVFEKRFLLLQKEAGAKRYSYQLHAGEKGRKLHTWSFFCSMLISEYSWAVASAAAKAFFFWLFARFGTEVVMGIGVWTILIGEFSGKSSNWNIKTVHTTQLKTFLLNATESINTLEAKWVIILIISKTQ